MVQVLVLDASEKVVADIRGKDRVNAALGRAVQHVYFDQSPAALVRIIGGNDVEDVYHVEKVSTGNVLVTLLVDRY